MTNVQFNEEQQYSKPVSVQRTVPTLSTLVIRWGIVKDEKGAQTFFLCFIVFAIIITGLMFWLGAKEDLPVPRETIEKALPRQVR